MSMERSGPERSNARSSLRRRRRTGDPMAAYDRLPPELRLWLAEAALPWSAGSALRVWSKALRACGGDTAEARRQLSHLERRRLSEDAPRIWGTRHPISAEHPA
ncbi:DUF6525 family protein [Salipiger sp. HF18]|uniref:DUF6525 family protein n=1 Tax=Salipiger sp. HF18 TaxID=2721557 RepID=UPI0034C6C4E1